MVGLELVADRGDPPAVSGVPPASPRRSCSRRDGRGVLVYSGTGNADGVDGDTILLGPPFIVTDDELVRIADVLAEAVSRGGRRIHGRCRRPHGLGRARASATTAAHRGTRHRTRASPRARASAIGTTSPPTCGESMFTPPSSASRPPNQACHPSPPPEAALTAAMNRKATPKQNVPRPSRARPASVSTPGTASAVMIAPAYREPVPRSTAHLMRKAIPTASTISEPRRARLREQLAGEQQPAEHEQEDADPGQAGPARLVRPPLPGVDATAPRARSPAAAVGRQAGHVRVRSVVHPGASLPGRGRRWGRGRVRPGPRPRRG